jgi:uncharacterized protein (TIGR02118 family)
MIKVSVLYPFQPEARFDHSYYREKHLPMIQKLMGDACLGYTIDRGLSGARPGSDPLFLAACHIHCASLDAFQTAFGPHAKTIMADVANYTDITPQMQVSEVVSG